MKRWLAIFTIVALLCACFPGLGEGLFPELTPVPTPEPEPRFFDALADWAGQLNLEQSDYTANLIENGLSRQASLRQDDTITELSLPDLGVFQFDGRSLLIDLNDQTYRIDIADLIPANALPRIDAQALDAGGAMLADLAAQAFQAVLLPSVSLQSFYNGLSFHIDIDDVQLEQRLFAFIDEFMAKPGQLERLMDVYGSLLEALLPDMSLDAAQLRALWAEADFQGDVRKPRCVLEADLTISSGYSLEIACNGSLSYPYNLYASAPNNRIAFGFDCISNDSGFTASATVDALFGMRSAITINATLEGRDNQLHGTLAINNTYPLLFTLDAALDANALTATLRCEGIDDNPMELRLDASDNPESGLFTATLEETYQSYYDDAPTTTRLATLNARYSENGLSGELTLPGTTLTLRAVLGAQFSRVTLKYNPTGGYALARSWDLWIVRPDSIGYRCRLESTATRRDSRFQHMLYELNIENNGISFKRSDLLRNDYILGSYRCISMPHAFLMEVEFEQSVFSNYNYSAARGFRLNIDQSQQTCSASFNLYDPNSSMTLNGTLALDEFGAVSSLDIESETSSTFYGTETSSRYALSYVPDRLSLSSNGTGFILEKVSETADDITFSLSDLDDMELLRVNLTVNKAAQSLVCTLLEADEVTGSLEIAPVAKTPIEPLDSETAIPLAPYQLMDLLFNGPAPGVDERLEVADEESGDDATASEETIEEAVEVVEEAAEDAVEVVEDAVEDAADAVEDAAEEAADAVEEAIEDAADAVEEAAEKAADAVEETDDAVENAIEKYSRRR